MAAVRTVLICAGTTWPLSSRRRRTGVDDTKPPLSPKGEKMREAKL